MIIQMYPVYSVMLILFCVSYLAQFFLSILDGYQKMELKNLNVIIQRLLNFVLIILVLNHSGGLYGIFIVGIVSWLAVIIINLYQVGKIFKEFSLSVFHFTVEKLRLLVSFGWKLQITTFASWAYNNLDKLFLGYFTDLATVSIYDIASRIKNLTRVPVTAYAGSIVPAASEIAATSHWTSVKDFYYRHSKYLLLIVFPINFFIFVNSKSLINLWVGPGFEKAALILQILIIGNTLNLLTGVGTSVARGMNKPGIEAKYTASVTVLILFLGYFLTKYYGLIGLSIGSTIAIGVPSFWFMIVLNQYLKIDNIRYLYDIIRLPLLLIIAVSSLDYVSYALINCSLLNKNALLFFFAAKFSIYYAIYFLMLRASNYIGKKI
jgi:O-antigen/teichoic acid export membrane protein